MTISRSFFLVLSVLFAFNVVAQTKDVPANGEPILVPGRPPVGAPNLEDFCEFYSDRAQQSVPYWDGDEDGHPPWLENVSWQVETELPVDGRVIKMTHFAETLPDGYYATSFMVNKHYALRMVADRGTDALQYMELWLGSGLVVQVGPDSPDTIIQFYFSMSTNIVNADLGSTLVEQIQAELRLLAGGKFFNCGCATDHLLLFHQFLNLTTENYGKTALMANLQQFVEDMEETRMNYIPCD